MPLALLLAPLATAATLSTGDFETLQEAVDAAADGDLILVGPGAWDGPVEIEVDVTLVAEPGTATLSGPSEGAALVFRDAAATVVGLDVAAGERGIEVRSGQVRLVDLAVSGARGESGGGIYARDARLELVRVDLGDNDVGEGAGGHLFATGSEIVAVQCSFLGGAAQRGGAALLHEGDAIIASSTLVGNTAVGGEEDGRGGALRVESGSLDVRSSVLEDNRVVGGYGGHVSAFEAEVALHDSVLADGVADGGYGGALALYDSSLLATGAWFEANEAIAADGELGFGGAIAALGDSAAGVSIQGSWLSANVAATRGGAVRVVSGDLEVAGSRLWENRAERGGALHLSSTGSAALSASALLDNEADYGGAVSWRPGEGAGALEVDGSWLQGNAAAVYGGGIYANGAGDLAVTRSALQGNTAGTGGAMLLWSVDSAEVSASCLRGNATTGEDDAHGGAAMVYQSGSTTWTGNLLAGNTAAARGGALRLSEVESVAVVNNHLLGNDASQAGGAISLRDVVAADLTNDLIAWTESTPALSADAATTASGGYLAVLDNAAGDGAAGDVLDGAVSDDPLVGWVPGADCYGDAPWPEPASPLVDAGDPSLSDPDGSRSDIGAFGGPHADLDAFTDADMDGWSAAVDCDDGDVSRHPTASDEPHDGVDGDCSGADRDDLDGDGFLGADDCDDGDPLVFPGAEDRPWDGVDADCAGDSDYDGDGDGHDHEAFGGEDCDDFDAGVHPDASEVVGDGVDQDCDGVDLVEEDLDEAGSCSCASGGASGWWMLAAIPLAWRRRR